MTSGAFGSGVRKDFRERAREVAEAGLEAVAEVIASEGSSAEAKIQGAKLAAQLAGMDVAAVPSDRMPVGGLTIIVPIYEVKAERGETKKEVTFDTTNEGPMGAMESGRDAEAWEFSDGGGGAEEAGAVREVHEAVVGDEEALIV